MQFLLVLVAASPLWAAALKTAQHPPEKPKMLNKPPKPEPEAEKPDEKEKKNKTELAKGHFYRSDGCEDCYYKHAQCGCQPAMEYFACLTKHCHKADTPNFADKCAALWSNCSTEVDIDCRGPETACKSKWHQLPTGGIGLSVNVDEDKAFCGPHGKCIGKIQMNVRIHGGAGASKVGSPAPAPGVVSMGPSPAAQSIPQSIAAAPATIPQSASMAYTIPLHPVWLECGLPAVTDANISNKKDWKICRKEVKGDTADCNMNLFNKLEIGGEKKAYCVLTAGKDGKRLTDVVWNVISNVHDLEDLNRTSNAHTTSNDEGNVTKPDNALSSGQLRKEQRDVHEDIAEADQAIAKNRKLRRDLAANATQEEEPAPPAPTTPAPQPVKLPAEFR